MFSVRSCLFNIFGRSLHCQCLIIFRGKAVTCENTWGLCSFSSCFFFVMNREAGEGTTFFFFLNSCHNVSDKLKCTMCQQHTGCVVFYSLFKMQWWRALWWGGSWVHVQDPAKQIHHIKRIQGFDQKIWSDRKTAFQGRKPSHHISTRISNQVITSLLAFDHWDTPLT